MTSPSDLALYVYGLARADAVPPPRGVGGAEVVKITLGPVAAFASWVERGGLAASEELLWEHEAVCETLMNGGPVLPARFGTLFASADELEDAVAARRERIAAALTRVTGRVELGVRAFSNGEVSATSSGAPEGGGSGRAYLERRRSKERDRDETAHALHGALLPLAADAHFRTLPIGPAFMAGAYLVDADSVDDFRRRVVTVQRNFPLTRIVCTGPWPPYSFAEFGSLG